MIERPSLESIDPTVFIGLGGAGGHVLGRISRLFHEEFGSQVEERGGASPLQFLLLDTDDFEKLPQQVRDNLGNREQDFLSLSHFNPQRYALRQRKLPDSDLQDWFDPAALRFLEDGIIRDGASRLRMLGRLCLHYHYREVEQRIRLKMESAADADVQRMAARVRPEPRPLRVFLISSSCGGTGSAVFLDVAAMVNRLARDRGISPSVVGFAFLPFPYIEANAQIDPALEPFYRDNAWAFFEELNHFLLHPGQLPKYALDLDRARGSQAPAAEYGQDVIRTVFLLDSHIPTVGTLELPELYAYAAQGIFHVFLTPEEGAVQSHYSNIKTKLNERDRIFGLMKRFATFGYAEYRLRPERLVQRLAAAVVEEEWERLNGAEPDESAVEAEAAELGAILAAQVDKERELARKWSPIMPVAAAVVDQADSAADLHRLPNEHFGSAQRQLEKAEKSLPTSDELVQRLQEFVAGRLDERLSAPPLGVVGEQRVVERIRRRVQQLALELRAAPSQPPLAVDEEITTRVRELSGETSRIWQRRWYRASPSADPRAAQRFAQGLGILFADLQKAAYTRYADELDRRLGIALDGLDAELERRMRRLDSLAAELGRKSGGSGTEAGIGEAPTIREFPSEAEVKGLVADRVGRMRSLLNDALREGQKRLWTSYHSSGEGVARSASELREALEGQWREELWRRAEELLPATSNPLDDAGAAAARDERGDPYLALFPMSYPPCPLDHGSLHKADTVSRIPVIMWPWERSEADEAKIRRRLRIPGAAQLRGSGERKRVAVLQAWYGFTSRALEGMETLRRSYLERHRATSLPHIHVAWNQKGIGCAGDALARLSDDEVLLAARALALSHTGPAAPRRQVELPGLRIVRDDRDPDPFYLLRYAEKGGRTFLYWRDIRPVEGHRQTWEVVYTGRTSGDSCAGEGVRASAGEDLQHDLSAYLSSEVRPRHAQFLSELDVLEREREGEADTYRDAYRKYLEFLDGLIRDENERGREVHLPVLFRLSDVLHRHVRGLTTHASRPL